MKQLREFMENSNVDRESKLWTEAENALSHLEGKTFIQGLYKALEALENSYYQCQEDETLKDSEIQRTVSLAEDLVRLAIEQAKGGTA